LPDWSLGTAYEALGRGDNSPLLALLGEEFEWVEPELPGYPLGGVHRGALEVRTRVLEELARLLEGLTIEGEEMVEAGSRVVVTGVIRGRPAGGDEEWELPFSHVWEIERGGRPQRVRTYFDRSRLTLAASRAQLDTVAQDLIEQAAEIRRQWEKLAETARAAELDDAPDDEAPAAGGSKARLAAVDMAEEGSSRDEVESHLRDELGVEDPGPILDEVFGEPEPEPAPEAEAAPAALDERAAELEATRLSRLFARNRS
jgi:ketosteroid isomerase-like protein